MGAQARAARGPGLRRTEDDTESELEEEQSDETETEVGIIRRVAISSAQRRRERRERRAARRPGLRRAEDDTESELEEEQGVGTAFEVVGNMDIAITMLAFIGAFTMLYHGLKMVHKMVFPTSEFQKIDDNEIEC